MFERLSGVLILTSDVSTRAGLRAVPLAGFNTRCRRRHVPLLLIALILSAVAPLMVAQQKDAEGCKDSPLVGRFPGSVITSCDQKADNTFTFTLDNSKNKSVEGNYVVIEYNFPKTATKAQVVRNMHAAMKTAGYTFVYDSGDYGDFTVNHGNTWIQIEISGSGNYKETIMAEATFPQLVVAHLPPQSSDAAGSAANVKPERPDAQGCKDSPIVGRFPGSYITSCTEKADNAFEFTMGDGKPKKKLEGHYLELEYDYPKTASKPQVVRNMNTAFRNAGYVFDYDSGDYGDFTVHMGSTWVQIEISASNNYKETILSLTNLTQDVVANAAALKGGLAVSGHIVVPGILFDTAKADVKPESGPAIEQIAKLLQGDPSLKIYVVGHTDNVGGLASNLDLSKRRAASVVQILETQYHVAADRLSPYGCGPYAPIQSNDTEAGRALNRRVELVKQ